MTPYDLTWYQKIQHFPSIKIEINGRNLGLFIDDFDAFKRDVDCDSLLVIADRTHGCFQLRHSNLRVKQLSANLCHDSYIT